MDQCLAGGWHPAVWPSHTIDLWHSRGPFSPWHQERLGLSPKPFPAGDHAKAVPDARAKHPRVESHELIVPVNSRWIGQMSAVDQPAGRFLGREEVAMNHQVGELIRPRYTRGKRPWRDP